MRFFQEIRRSFGRIMAASPPGNARVETGSNFAPSPTPTKALERNLCRLEPAFLGKHVKSCPREQAKRKKLYAFVSSWFNCPACFHRKSDRFTLSVFVAPRWPRRRRP